MGVPTPGSTIALKPGETLHIDRLLGSGGMGSVVAATHAPSGQRLALKFLHDELRDHPTIPKRFEREVELATALSTAHVTRTFGHGQTADGTPFMIMEYLEGRDLCGLLRDEGRIEPWRAARLIAQACEALEEAHVRGIVHRDIKPENLFVTRAADGSDWVKVLDFGISKVMDDATVGGGRQALTRVGTTVGTPEYMSPEQLRGARDLDGTADVYSLGCVLYELLAGRRPFAAKNHDELARLICTGTPVPVMKYRTDVPPGLVAVIEHAMTRERERRLSSAKLMREALQPFVNQRRGEGTWSSEPRKGTELAIPVRGSFPGEVPPTAGVLEPRGLNGPVESPPPTRASFEPVLPQVHQVSVPPNTRPFVGKPAKSGSSTWVFVLIGVVIALVALALIGWLSPSVIFRS